MRKLKPAIVLVVTVGWAVCIADALPGGEVPVGVARLSMMAAAVGSVTLLAMALLRPVVEIIHPLSEVYAAGKIAGRAEAMADVDGAPAPVLSLVERQG